MGGAGPIRIGEPGSKWWLKQSRSQGSSTVSDMPPIVLT